MAATIRILVVDDNDAVRHGICGVLRTEPDFEVVSEATNGEQAITEAEKFQPDVIVLDINMKGLREIR